MMKTLYYNVIYREYGQVYNEGFLIATIEDGKMKNIEGVLTLDYITSYIDDRVIDIRYYVPSEDFRDLQLEFRAIRKNDEYFELPLEITIPLNDGYQAELNIFEQITDPKKKSDCQSQLEDYKKCFY